MKLKCHFSWQAQYLVKFGMIAGARNVVFFPKQFTVGFPLRKKSGVHRLARACSGGRGVGVAWAWLGRGVGLAWARAWAWRGVGVGLGVAWAWAWRGRLSFFSVCLQLVDLVLFDSFGL